jgi:hypothetical protein
MTSTIIDCGSLGPDGVRCAKIAGHHGTHGGIDRHGSWRHWF